MNEKAELIQFAKRNGIADLGFCSAEPLSVYADFVLERKEERKCYLEIGFAQQANRDWYTPKAHLPTAQGIIVVLLPYDLKRMSKIMLQEGEFRLSEAAVFLDYHVLLQEQLLLLAKEIEEKYHAQSQCYTDTGPLNDKSLALRAGLGKIGYNSLLLHPKFGSRFYIGYILTELSFVDEIAEETSFQELLHPFCINCKRCEKACPNQAIDQRGSINANRCISFLTQSKEWQDSPGEGLHLAKYLYGCDICQQVCPLNGIPLKEYQRTPLVSSVVSYDDIAQLSNKEFAHQYKKTSAGWIGKKRFLRNANYQKIASEEHE